MCVRNSKLDHQEVTLQSQAVIHLTHTGGSGDIVHSRKSVRNSTTKEEIFLVAALSHSLTLEDTGDILSSEMVINVSVGSVPFPKPH